MRSFLTESQSAFVPVCLIEEVDDTGLLLVLISSDVGSNYNKVVVVTEAGSGRAVGDEVWAG